MKHILFSALIISCFSSCYHVYYAPNSANAPLLSEKGETRINLLYSGGGDSEFNGGEIQAAHAVGKNFGVMLNGFSAGKTENTGSYTEEGKGSYAELAGGYFKALDARQKWIGEVYGGFGMGTVKNDYGYNDFSKVNCSKLFIQPAIGYKGNYFEFAIVPKISLVNWRVKEDKIISTENQSYKTDLAAIRSNSSFLTFEPALLVRGGGKDFKIQAGLSFSTNTTTSYYSSGLSESLTGHLGVSINISPSSRN